MQPPRHPLCLLAFALAASALAPSAALATADPQPNRIRIEYVPPTSPEHQPIYEMVKERRALEKLQEIFGAFRLPIDLTLRTVGCDGVANAWYQTGRVSVCYEYLQEIHKNMPKEVTPEGVTPVDAVAGQFFFVVTHEMGHAMFDLLNVPVFGGGETAADHFATFIILQFGQEQARRLILGAAYSYKRFLRSPTVTAPVVAFSDVHSPPPERFYNLVCLAYGAHSTLFADLVDKDYLPKSRARGCRREYGEIAYAFNKLIAPHLDKSIAEQVMKKEWLPEQGERPGAH
jgi:hypothetical protein